MPGEPVYEMDCQDDDKEKSDNNEKTVQMLNQMEIKFKERFTEATEQVNTYLHMNTEEVGPKPSGKLSRLTSSFGCTLTVRQKFFFF